LTLRCSDVNVPFRNLKVARTRTFFPLTWSSPLLIGTMSTVCRDSPVNVAW